MARRDVYGRRYAFDYDRSHALSLVGSYRISRRLDVGLTARIASGFPYVPALGVRVAGLTDSADADGDGNVEEIRPETDAEGRLVYTTDLGGLGNLNAGRLPTYARLDTRLSYRPGWGKERVTLYLDVINVFNRKNAGMMSQELEYDPTSDQPRVEEKPDAAIPFLPSIGIHVRFGGPSGSKPDSTKPVPPAEPPAGAPAQPGRTARWALGFRPIGSQGFGVDLARSLRAGASPLAWAARMASAPRSTTP